MELKFDTPYDILLEIVKEKHAQLLPIMLVQKIDCWLVFIRETSVNPDPTQNLIIGGDIVWESAFIFSFQDNKLVKTAIVGNFDAEAEKRKNIWDEVIPYKEGISKILSNYINKIKPSKIALNYSLDDVSSDGLSYGMYLKLIEILPNYKDKFVSASQIIQKLRCIKTETEIKLLTESAELTEQINNEVSKEFKLGTSEKEIQKLFYNKMDSLGVIESWQRKSCPAIDAGPEKEMGHVGPSNLVIKKGHSLHNDFGIKLNGYCSDIQRMWFFGKENELPGELRHAFDTVHGAITRAANFIKPGVKGWEVDKIARDYVMERGYEEFAHALGHQVGLAAHDGGMILGPLWERYGELPNGKVELGNIFTLELVVTTKNYGSVSLEEEILVTKDGCKFLIPRQMDWIYLDIN